MVTTEIRLLTDDDAHVFAELSAAIEADHPTNLQLNAVEFVEMRSIGGVVAEGGFEGDELVAWSAHLAREPHATGHGFQLFGDVHPAWTGRGWGTAMAARALDAARRLHREQAPDLTARYVYRSVSGRPDAAAVAAGLGLEVARYRFNMVVELASLPPARQLPEQLARTYEVVTFVPEESERLRAAHNVAFDGYPHFLPWDESLWAGFMVTARHVRHPLSFWVRERGTGEVAAYLFTHEYAAALSGRTDAPETYVPYLATLPKHRGRGLGSWLLGHSLAAYRAAGYATATLEVDAENPTGALGMYERAGFVAAQRFDEYQLTE